LGLAQSPPAATTGIADLPRARLRSGEGVARSPTPTSSLYAAREAAGEVCHTVLPAAARSASTMRWSSLATRRSPTAGLVECHAGRPPALSSLGSSRGDCRLRVVHSLHRTVAPTNPVPNALETLAGSIGGRTIWVPYVLRLLAV
jgi:hypothetical protein